MQRIVSISPDTAQRDYQTTVALELAGAPAACQPIAVRRIGTGGDIAQVVAQLRAHDGQADALALEALPPLLRVGAARYLQPDGARLVAEVHTTPVSTGSLLQETLERWAIRCIAEREPALLHKRRVLVLNGCAHYALAQMLADQTGPICYADPILQTGLACAPVLRSLRQLEDYAATVLPLLLAARRRSLAPQWGWSQRVRARLHALIARADVVVGSFACIAQLAPPDLRHCTIITDAPAPADVEDLRRRGAATLITLAPPVGHGSVFLTTAVIEALLLLTLRQAHAPAGPPPGPSALLNLFAATRWEPTIQHLSPPARRPRFAFVVHPMQAAHIARRPPFGFTRYLPAPLVERVAAHVPPLYLARIRGIRSQATGEEIEGVLLTLGATPREMLRRPPAFTLKRLVQAAAMAEQMGARIMGLGAFTSVVGDAGVSLARQTDIGITTGNALTVAVTLETARLALQLMGRPLDQARVVVVGATGSIGAACARLLAAEARQLMLVAPRPERLLALQRQIAEETPGASIQAALEPDATNLAQTDLIITATTALSRSVLDLQRLKPGAVVCDVARPPNVRQADAARRPDVLVLESGELLLPGAPDFGVELDLPPGLAYACLAETALLALEGRFADYTLGRTIEPARIREIARLMHRHGLKLAHLHSFGRALTSEDILRVRRLACAQESPV